MEIKKIIKILCVINDLSIDDLAKSLNISSRQLLYHHIKKRNLNVLKQIEQTFNLTPNSLTLNTVIFKVIS
ncbi:MAG: hypothetical protein ACRC4T_17175 [Cetobacterium sp.]